MVKRGVQKAVGKKVAPKAGKKLVKIAKKKKVQKYGNKLFRKGGKKAAIVAAKHLSKQTLVLDGQEITKEDALLKGIDEGNRALGIVQNQLEQMKTTEENENDIFENPWEGTCPICMENMSSLVVLEPCDHQFCIGCGQKYLQEQIENLQETVFPCPIENCPEFIDHNFTLKLLEKSQYFAEEPGKMSLKSLRDHYDYLTIAVALSEEKELVWCPSLDCHWAALRGPNRGKCPEIECENCSQIFCSICQTPGHFEEPCRYWGDVAALYPEFVRKCPTCKVPQMRDSDIMWCHYVRCGDEKCRCNFCWCCGEKVISRHHFTAPPRPGQDACRLGFHDIWFGFLWPLRLYMDCPFFIHWFIWFFLMPPTVIFVFFYIWFTFPCLWTKKLWRKQKNWGCPCCIRLCTCLVVFGFFYFYAIIVGAFAAVMTLGLFNLYCMLSCPCIPLSAPIKAGLYVLEFCFSCLGMFPEFVLIAKQISEAIEEMKNERFEQADQQIEEENESQQEEPEYPSIEIISVKDKFERGTAGRTSTTRTGDQTTVDTDTRILTSMLTVDLSHQPDDRITIPMSNTGVDTESRKTE